ncbi:hypothetical protein ACFOEE_19810 [Pseudoalteromonas fenneropenaei]|uniref:DUF2946 domain-containing protein n=1 Tax=Pseudoalteromonas fenneropenaei TaxID=1737459 RepID=A0ABV7CQD3_9GAMM
MNRLCLVKATISWLIALTLLLQAGLTLADTQVVHQLESSHLQIEHAHQLDVTVGSQLLDESGHHIKDCHHCGHCSGSHLSWLVLKSVMPSASRHLVAAGRVPSSFIAISLTPELRPPIA